LSRLDLVLLPGMDGTGRLLAHLAAILGERRWVSIVRYPTDGAQSYAALTAYARAALPERPCVVLGESFSGPIAIALAASDPRVVGLILASAFAQNPLSALAAPFTRINPALVPTAITGRFLLGFKPDPALLADLRATLDSVPAATLAARATTVRGLGADRTLSVVGCPVLSMQGRRDWCWLENPFVLCVSSAQRVAWCGLMRRICSFRRTLARQRKLSSSSAQAVMSVDHYASNL
jgi:pimeloyl-[acyl-carrier protein] methyl ester esterase